MISKMACTLCRRMQRAEQQPTSMVDQRSRDIEHQLMKLEMEERSTIKILMLGTPGSGKSTIVRQIKLSYLSGFSETDLINYRYVIHSNVIDIVVILIREMEERGTQVDDKTLLAYVDYIKTFYKIYATHKTELTSDFGQVAKAWWNDTAVQECFNRRHEYYLPDNAKYWMDNLKRITAQQYRPTVRDILHCRLPTTGITETGFRYKNCAFRLIDAGGQRSQRRKWIHCFDNVSAILFIASLAEYDMHICEDEEMNRMHESLDLFESIIRTIHLRRAAMVLFLNKLDIFEEKILTRPISLCFPNAEECVTAEAGKDFILHKFLERSGRTRLVYPHFICAVDSPRLKPAFESLLDLLIQRQIASKNIVTTPVA